MTHLQGWPCTSSQRSQSAEDVATRALVVALLVCALAASAVPAFGFRAVSAAVPPAILSECQADLAERLDVDVERISVEEYTPVVWPDSSIGMATIGQQYTQALTRGYRAVLAGPNERYLYTTTDKRFAYGGPLPVWSCSTLYLQEVEGEPNLNSDLYQCSMSGTNASLLLSGVTQFWPQEGGVVLAKRRTSRSGHDLLYVKAGLPDKARLLMSAFDFGEAAYDPNEARWAAFCRPRLGSEWNISLAEIGEGEARLQTLSLPEGAGPGRIAWSGGKLMILVDKVCYEMTLDSDPEWKEKPVYEFPTPTYMLNKSETLEVEQVDEDGEPAVAISRVWFTGDRNTVARIPNFTMKGWDLVGCCYAFVWGRTADGNDAWYTVDVGSGEIIAGPAGDYGSIRPFTAPPRETPLTVGGPSRLAGFR